MGSGQKHSENPLDFLSMVRNDSTPSEEVTQNQGSYTSINHNNRSTKQKMEPSNGR